MPTLSGCFLSHAVCNRPTADLYQAAKRLDFVRQLDQWIRANGRAHSSMFIIDVVKNKIMTQPDVKNPPFPTVVSCFKHVYRTDGLKGFYRGMSLGSVYDIPNVACIISCSSMDQWINGYDLRSGTNGD